MRSNNPKGKRRAQFSYEGLERLMHEKSRLSILTSLFVNKAGQSFLELKNSCNLSDGNLSRQLTKLKNGDLISIEKTFDKNKSLTRCRLTTEGRKRYKMYVAELEKVIRDAAAVNEMTKATKSSAAIA